MGKRQLQDEKDLQLELQLRRVEAAFWHKFDAAQVGLPVRATAMLLCMQSAPAKMQFNRKNETGAGPTQRLQKDWAPGTKHHWTRALPNDVIATLIAKRGVRTHINFCYLGDALHAYCKCCCARSSGNKFDLFSNLLHIALRIRPVHPSRRPPLSSSL